MRDERSKEDGSLVEADRRRGRGARSNRVGRFESETREAFDDGWESLADLEPFKTDVRSETAKSIISSNDSPDVGFEQSINPYRGCEHGCIYCYARPTHCYLGHSAGLDFETKLYAKVNAAELLERELGNPRYVPKFIALGAVTDPYQPIEREHRITRSVLVAPIIPALNDSEIESILGAARDAGATEAGFVLLRLPLELKELFREWLQTEFPDRAARTINILRSMHGGKDYTPEWGVRQRGRGPYAEQIEMRFRLAVRRLGLNERTLKLRTDLFQRPVPAGGQLPLL